MPEESILGIIERVTFHSEETGWSVLKVQPLQKFSAPITVTVHQSKVFAGATVKFVGAWSEHPKFGRQFKADIAEEQKPATIAALQKYLGSGLIKGVGPKTAAKIVDYFGDKTLDIFEQDIESLKQVPGIARKKLAIIKEAWLSHRVIRDVMMFLQSHGISTLFAVRIFKHYGEKANEIVAADPYRLANDFYGIGFLSADKVAQSLGIPLDSPQRIIAAIKHVLSGSRDRGHCYLRIDQIIDQVQQLLGMTLDTIPAHLDEMERTDLLKKRTIAQSDTETVLGYYAKGLYWDELAVAKSITRQCHNLATNTRKVLAWIEAYCNGKKLTLSPQQAQAVAGIIAEKFSVLTGGPGCGKTTTTKVLVDFLQAMDLRVLLAAPTGRAAQRMSEVVGLEAKTIHRLLEWQGGFFKRGEDDPLDADFLIVDECSMLDISLSASLLKAVPDACQVLFIGDADQLPSVGAGNVLRDIIASKKVPCFVLSQIFRQAQKSKIITFAHQINSGETPHIDSPFHRPHIWQESTDCLFIDCEEATREQLNFIARIKRMPKEMFAEITAPSEDAGAGYEFGVSEEVWGIRKRDFVVPAKFRHVDLDKLSAASGAIEELRTVLKQIPPWSALYYGLTASKVIEKLCLEWIPKYYGKTCEIQVLSPMTRGSLGTHRLNAMIQNAGNPAVSGKKELSFGENIFRMGDRVIHRRNNYDLGVFNGDIGVISGINNERLNLEVMFFPDRRVVCYERENITELELAYAITIHKSQGSEFEAVVIPVVSQHFKMLNRNLMYTGLTRARKLAVFVGSRKALAMAVRNRDSRMRQTYLRELLIGGLEIDRAEV